MSLSCVSGPKLRRRKPPAMSAGTPIAASTWLACALPDEQALPADTAIPARSSWISIAALFAPASAIAPIVGDSRCVFGDDHRTEARARRPRASAKPRHSLHVVGPRGQRSGKGQRARHILSSAPIALLLPAAARLQRVQVADQQRADPRRTAELVGANGDEIGVGKRHLRRALRAIGEQQAPGVADFRCEPVERLDHAGLIIDLLDCDQRRPFARTVSSAASSISPSRSTGRTVDLAPIA